MAKALKALKAFFVLFFTIFLAKMVQLSFCDNHGKWEYKPFMNYTFGSMWQTK